MNEEGSKSDMQLVKLPVGYSHPYEEVCKSIEDFDRRNGRAIFVRNWLRSTLLLGVSFLIVYLAGIYGLVDAVTPLGSVVVFLLFAFTIVPFGVHLWLQYNQSHNLEFHIPHVVAILRDFQYKTLCPGALEIIRKRAGQDANSGQSRTAFSILILSTIVAGGAFFAGAAPQYLLVLAGLFVLFLNILLEQIKVARRAESILHGVDQYEYEESLPDQLHIARRYLLDHKGNDPAMDEKQSD
jgi:hypothetical protein